MTIGPLRGLAARALGLEQPLQTLRLPALAESVTAEPSLVQALAPATPVQLSSAAEPLPLAATVSQLGKATEAKTLVPANRGGVARRGLVEPPAPRPAHVAAAGPAPVAPLWHEPRSTQNEHDASATLASGGDGQPSAASAERAPTPLMPLLATLPLPRTSTRAGRGHRDAPSARPRLAAESVPTEVHVSIGRVELTAVSPQPASAPGRSAARRADADGRSLAAYLRGDVRSV